MSYKHSSRSDVCQWIDPKWPHSGEPLQTLCHASSAVSASQYAQQSVAHWHHDFIGAAEQASFHLPNNSFSVAGADHFCKTKKSCTVQVQGKKYSNTDTTETCQVQVTTLQLEKSIPDIKHSCTNETVPSEFSFKLQQNLAAPIQQRSLFHEILSQFSSGQKEEDKQKCCLPNVPPRELLLVSQNTHVHRKCFSQLLRLTQCEWNLH